MKENEMTSEAKIPTEGVRIAFELLQEELGQTLELTRAAAADTVRTGNYQLVISLIDEAKGIETVAAKLSEIHDQWAEEHDKRFGYDAGQAVIASGPELIMDYNKKIRANAIYNDGRVVVKNGSVINSETFPSLSERCHVLRKKTDCRRQLSKKL